MAILPKEFFFRNFLRLRIQKYVILKPKKKTGNDTVKFREIERTCHLIALKLFIHINDAFIYHSLSVWVFTQFDVNYFFSV